VVQVHFAERQVEVQTVNGTNQRVPYDFLVLACGSTHSYFGNPQWEEHAPGLKTLEQATEIRRRVLLAFERAEQTDDPEEQKRLLTFVVIGGGPTGVELAGALGEISRHTLARDFRRIDPAHTRVLLIEAGPRVLPAFDPELSKRAARDLEELGVQIWTRSRVTGIDATGVTLGTERILAGTTLWAAGVEPMEIARKLGVELGPQGRVRVEETLSLPGHPEVYAIGDMANLPGPDGKPLPGLAPVAIQQGRHVARNIERALAGQAGLPFRYFDKGMLATIGRKMAVGQFKRIRFAGFTAWAAWLFVHIYYLIGFKNRVFVLAQWAWAYLSFRKGARLIVEKNWRSPAADQAPEPLKAMNAPQSEQAR
jgi:NADH dehydrogenase